MILFAMILVTSFPSVRAESAAYVRARTEWLRVTVARFEMARHLELQRSKSTRVFRSDARLARAIGVHPYAVQRWADGRAQQSLEDGRKVAAFFDVETWWLLAFDVLHRAYWSLPPEARPESIDGSDLRPARYGEILRAAREFDPSACDGFLERLHRRAEQDSEVWSWDQPPSGDVPSSEIE